MFRSITRFSEDVLFTVVVGSTQYPFVFAMQATHDLLEFGPFQLSSFDHLEFPGVVPRTFWGALLVSLPVSPIYSALRAAGCLPSIGIYLGMDHGSAIKLNINDHHSAFLFDLFLTLSSIIVWAKTFNDLLFQFVAHCCCTM